MVRDMEGDAGQILVSSAVGDECELDVDGLSLLRDAELPGFRILVGRWEGIKVVAIGKAFENLELMTIQEAESGKGVGVFLSRCDDDISALDCILRSEQKKRDTVRLQANHCRSCGFAIT